MGIPQGGKDRDIVDANIAQLKMLVAQAVLFRRDNGRPAMAMREVVAAILASGEGKQIRLMFGTGDDTKADPKFGPGSSIVSIARSSDAQMMVSIMHEFLHAADMMRSVAGLSVLEISTDMRHDEIYRIQNQTLHDLVLPLDPGPDGRQVKDRNGTPNGDAYIGPEW